MSKSVVRTVKNVTRGYSSVQVKVRNATSNDAWGPTGSEMSDIAQATFNSSGEFYEIMDMLDKRLNDKGKNWRHVLKSLKVLDYCLHEGSEHVVTWSRKNIYIIKTLREFQYVDEEGRDVGLNVRNSAKELTSLILDEERLRAERRDRKLWKSRVTGLDDNVGPVEPPKVRRPPRTSSKAEDNDLEMRLALEASKNEAEEDKARRASRQGPVAGEDDADLRKAIQLSREEEEQRRKQLEEQNAQSLFDDSPAQQPQPTGWNQGYQQQSAVDWFGNPVEAQQPQSTGYLNNAYAQPLGMQQTAFSDNYGYNPYGQQQQQQQQQQPQPQPLENQYTQQQYMQPQQTAFSMNNPYSTPQADQQPGLAPGSHNPWSSTSGTDGIAPQPTGSNNPFASGSAFRPQSTNARPPTLDTLREQKATTQFSGFNPHNTFQPQSQPQPQQQPVSHSPQPVEQDPHRAHLNALLASGDGLDTFGNVGELRIPSQHTAPGMFINSAGSSLARLPVNQTGSNPFMQSQFTGMQPTRLPPAQTGPVGGGYGGGFGGSGYGGNPYAGQQGQKQGGG